MVTVTQSIIQDNDLAEVERAVIAVEQAVADLARRAERHREASERPRWCDCAVWQTAVDEAARMGYTGHSVYARAADMLNDRYGYR